MAYRFIAAEKVNHAIATLCRVLRVSRSGFYAWQKRPPSARRVLDRDLIAFALRRDRGTRAWVLAGLVVLTQAATAVGGVAEIMALRVRGPGR